MRALFIGFIVVVAGTLVFSLSLGMKKNVSDDFTAPSAATTDRQPVLVELFTSEGCSSCPPADRLLTKLHNDQPVSNADVITLEFHVDYWNYLGWKDRFSTSAFTKRQEFYARQFGLDSSYTPQMVVDGRSEFVGSNRSKANEIIAQSATEAKPDIELAIAGEKLKVNIQGLKEHSDAGVFLAVAESTLTTKVGGGENSGSELEHTSVVRTLTQIGSVKKQDRAFTIEHAIPQNADWKTDNLNYVVFVQENSSLKILAVKQIGR